MKTTLSILICCLIGSCFPVMGTSFSPPRDHAVKSPNGQFALHIEADSGRHEVRKGDTLLWSFDRDVWNHDYYLSDDGKYILWISWKFVKKEDIAKEPALEVRSPTGIIFSKTFDQISKPRRYLKKEVGPIGDFWRVWRGDVVREGDEILIEVEGKEEPLRIDFTGIGESHGAQPEDVTKTEPRKYL